MIQPRDMGLAARSELRAYAGLELGRGGDVN